MPKKKSQGTDPKWDRNSTDGQMLSELLRNGEIKMPAVTNDNIDDLVRLKWPNYFKKYDRKKFCQNFRRMYNDYQVEIAAQGARTNNSASNRNSSNADDEDDTPTAAPAATQDNNSGEDNSNDSENEGGGGTDGGVDHLVGNMERMGISRFSASGNLILPFLGATYNLRNRIRGTIIVCLSSGVIEHDYTTRILKGGRRVELRVCYPSALLCPTDIFTQVFDPLFFDTRSGLPKFGADSAKVQALERAVMVLRPQSNTQFVERVMIIDIPFKAEEQFFDDHEKNWPGVKSVIIPGECEDDPHYVFLFLELISALTNYETTATPQSTYIRRGARGIHRSQGSTSSAASPPFVAGGFHPGAAGGGSDDPMNVDTPGRQTPAPAAAPPPPQQNHFFSQQAPTQPYYHGQQRVPPGSYAAAAADPRTAQVGGSRVPETTTANFPYQNSTPMGPTPGVPRAAAMPDHNAPKEVSVPAYASKKVPAKANFKGTPKRAPSGSNTPSTFMSTPPSTNSMATGLFNQAANAVFGQFSRGTEEQQQQQQQTQTHQHHESQPSAVSNEEHQDQDQAAGKCTRASRTPSRRKEKGRRPVKVFVKNQQNSSNASRPSPTAVRAPTPPTPPNPSDNNNNDDDVNAGGTHNAEPPTVHANHHHYAIETTNDDDDDDDAAVTVDAAAENASAGDDESTGDDEPPSPVSSSGIDDDPNNNNDDKNDASPPKWYEIDDPDFVDPDL